MNGYVTSECSICAAETKCEFAVRSYPYNLDTDNNILYYNTRRIGECIKTLATFQQNILQKA